MSSERNEIYNYMEHRNYYHDPSRVYLREPMFAPNEGDVFTRNLSPSSSSEYDYSSSNSAYRWSPEPSLSSREAAASVFEVPNNDNTDFRITFRDNAQAATHLDSCIMSRKAKGKPSFNYDPSSIGRVESAATKCEFEQQITSSSRNYTKKYLHLVKEIRSSCK
ncbi:hypothetical protein NPIL_559391 [Nephila pilipes]|uniref:Uncharacterized protein n=1 Tax=Nephila pilipes TaxID=299642 RepID=A0A8X6IDT2_NEPPI|nr:hypothetical protein NPIL_559391 [Nephila pilipes]